MKNWLNIELKKSKYSGIIRKSGFNFSGKLCYSDRVRTTNNMLGDCYAAAVVEHLSKAELQSSPSHGSIVKNLGEKDVSVYF
jgi:hypothetical protein